MASETDVRIARAVALKCVAVLVAGNIVPLTDLESKTNELQSILLNDSSIEPVGPSGDPGPAPPYEEDEAIGPPRTGAAEARHCGSAPEDSQGCGARLEWKEGVSAAGKDYAMWTCPNQKKTNDPAEQAAEKVRHPVQYPPK